MCRKTVCSVEEKADTERGGKVRAAEPSHPFAVKTFDIRLRTGDYFRLGIQGKVLEEEIVNTTGNVGRRHRIHILEVLRVRRARHQGRSRPRSRAATDLFPSASLSASSSRWRSSVLSGSACSACGSTDRIEVPPGSARKIGFRTAGW